MAGAEDTLARTGAADSLEWMGKAGPATLSEQQKPGQTDAAEESGMARLLSRRLAQGRLRVLERESSRVTVSLRERSDGGAGPGVRELDRAFRRDARRYDGGLTLL